MLPRLPVFTHTTPLSLGFPLQAPFHSAVMENATLLLGIFVKPGKFSGYTFLARTARDRLQAHPTSQTGCLTTGSRLEACSTNDANLDYRRIPCGKIPPRNPSHTTSAWLGNLRTSPTENLNLRMIEPGLWLKKNNLHSMLTSFVGVMTQACVAEDRVLRSKNVVPTRIA